MLVEPHTASRLHITCEISKDITTPLYHYIREAKISGSAMESQQNIRQTSEKFGDRKKVKANLANSNIKRPSCERIMDIWGDWKRDNRRNSARCHS